MSDTITHDDMWNLYLEGRRNFGYAVALRAVLNSKTLQHLRDTDPDKWQSHCYLPCRVDESVTTPFWEVSPYDWLASYPDPPTDDGLTVAE